MSQLQHNSAFGGLVSRSHKLGECKISTPQSLKATQQTGEPESLPQMGCAYGFLHSGVVYIQKMDKKFSPCETELGVI